MMFFTRTLTTDEVKRLGDNPTDTLNAFIDQGINQIKGGVTQRILSVMDNKTPMTARQIMDAHNAVHGRTPVTLRYARVVLASMAKVSIIKRKARGKYVR